MRIRVVLCTLAALAIFSAVGTAAEIWGLKAGTPKIRSASRLAFGPDGILLVGDTKSASIFAIETGDTSGDPDTAEVNIDGFQQKVADLLSASREDVKINDLAVNPQSGNVYAAVSKGEEPAIVAVHGDSLKELSLQNVKFSQVDLPNAPDPQAERRGRRLRDQSITDLAYIDGKVIVSGVTKGPGTSNVREVAFPFEEANSGSNLQIYHAAHGREEDYAAVRTFVPFMIDGEPNLLAGFTCTPLVRLPLNKITPGEKVRGTTVAELGNRNTPYDMIVYEKDNKTFLLMANDRRGVMKISTEGIEKNAGLTEPVRGGGKAGQPFETIEELKGVVQLDRLNDTHAVVLVQTDSVSSLQTIPLP